MVSIIQSLSNWLINVTANNSEERVEMIGEYDLIHVEQKYDWDCGVACLEMCLRWTRISNIEQYKCDFDIMEFKYEKSPLWTIDIFMGLHDYGVHSAVMYTTCKGIIQNFK